MQALLFFACKKYSSYNRDNSLMVERHFGGDKGSIPFYFLCINCKSYNEQKAI